MTFFFTFKDNEDKGERVDKIEEKRTLNEGKIRETYFIELHGCKDMDVIVNSFPIYVPSLMPW